MRTLSRSILALGVLALAITALVGPKLKTGGSDDGNPPEIITGTGDNAVTIILKFKNIGDAGLPFHYIIGPESGDRVAKRSPKIIKGSARGGATVVVSAQPPRTAPEKAWGSCSIEVNGKERDHRESGGPEHLGAFHDDGVTCITTV